MSGSHSIARKFSLFAVAALSLMLAACVGGDSDVDDSSSGASMSLDGFTSKKLAYGVGVAVPNSWHVQDELDPAANSKESINSRIASENHVILAAFVRPASTPEGADAFGRIAIIEQSKDIPPENMVLGLTGQDFEEWGTRLVQGAKEVAKKQGKPSSIDSVHISRAQADGCTALVFRRKGTGPQGDKLVGAEWFVYLPDNKMLLLNLVGASAVPGTETVFERIATSLKIKK